MRCIRRTGVGTTAASRLHSRKRRCAVGQTAHCAGAQPTPMQQHGNQHQPAASLAQLAHCALPTFCGTNQFPLLPSRSPHRAVASKRDAEKSQQVSDVPEATQNPAVLPLCTISARQHRPPAAPALTLHAHCRQKPRESGCPSTPQNCTLKRWCASPLPP